MSIKKGMFIVFEGIDGSGTSTQAEMLKNYFLTNKNSCHLTCEPSDGPIGNMIRQAFKGRLNLSKGKNPYVIDGNLFDEQMAYLFAADRHDHLYNEIDGVVKLINEGVTVISTRYYFSSYTYHCNSEADFELVTNLNSRFPKPDLVIYLDNTVDVSMDRMRSRVFKDEYENEKKLALVKCNYDKVFKQYEGEILFVDATKSIANIHNLIVEKILNLK
jgi:dTMP kinase